jgi:hypothetical protein
LTAVNLVLVLLFPPFEFFSAISKAALPTFEGLLFPVRRQLPAPTGDAILYIEVALVHQRRLALAAVQGQDSRTKSRRRKRGYWPAHPRRAEKVTGCGAAGNPGLRLPASGLVIA